MSEKDKWNNIIRSYNKWDVYYLAEYAETFSLHGDGIPYLISFEHDNERFCYVVMKKDISDDIKLRTYLESGKYFDFETPYGYGGPLSDNEISDNTQKEFLFEMNDYTKDQGIVAQFIRFHPLLENHKLAQAVFENVYLHQTVYMDISSVDLIMKNMDSKNRNMVRKAIKNNVEIIRRPIEDYTEFMSMYKETMTKDEAGDYYFFSEEYLRNQGKLKDNACIFYAVKDNHPIAGAIIYFNEQYMHYHLAGTHTEYRKLSPSNLLLYEAAVWGSEKRIKKFHLGGGIEENDKLFGFKKQFNKHGWIPFYIGRTIFDKDRYDFLLDIRQKADSKFNINNARMIQYRA